MKDQQVFDNYESFWKEIVENADGTLNKEQVMKELHDFSHLISSLSKLYCYISGGIVSKPMTKAEAVLQLFEEQLTEQYERGYEDAMADLAMGDESEDNNQSSNS